MEEHPNRYYKGNLKCARIMAAAARAPTQAKVIEGMKHEPFNESVEMYLKTVHELADGAGIVAISALARQLGVSAVSATEMVHRLQEQGYLEHLPYKGIHLTDDGIDRASQVVRSHQLWECFLFEHLKIPWAEVHEHACRLEHATDEAVTEALDAFLGHPAYCPHGNSIPGAAGAKPRANLVALCELATGQTGTVAMIYPERADLLSYLDRQGLRPGQIVILEEIAPFGGPLMVRAGDKVVAIGDEAARHVFVVMQEGIAS